MVLNEGISDEVVLERAIEFIGREKQRALQLCKVWQAKNDKNRIFAEKFFDEWNNIGRMTGKAEQIGDVERIRDGMATVKVVKVRLIYDGNTVGILFVRFRHDKPMNMALFNTQEDKPARTLAASMA